MGKNNPKPKDAAAATPAVTPSPLQMQSFPAFQPGMQGLLANQLANGFGGGRGAAAANMASLSNLYRPVEMPIIQRPDQIAEYLKRIGVKPITAATLPKPKAGSVGQSQGDYHPGYGRGDL